MNRNSIGDDNFYKPRMIEQFQFRFEYYLLANKYDEALKYIEERTDRSFVKKEDYIPWKILLQIEKKEYDKALVTAAELDKKQAPYFLNLIRLLKGDISGTDAFFTEYYKDYNSSATPSRVYYDYALIDIYNKRYEAALPKLKAALDRRGIANFFGYVSDEYPWKVYTAFGDAYGGLKKFENT
ncbi:MAG: hypothetical protein EOO43_11860 [Flavobacterium sp.]|nr:MAG: hypothetical protein EOO43_11860 [Flavobacterium sp.]